MSPRSNNKVGPVRPERKKIQVFKRDLMMNDNLAYALADFSGNKIYAAIFVFYLSVSTYLFCALVTRCVIGGRKASVESLYDYPEDCAEFARDYCIRSDLTQDSCRGKQYDKPIVFKSDQGTMGKVLAECVEDISAGYNYGVVTSNPVLDNCSFEPALDFPLRESGYARFQKLDCFTYAHVVFGDIWSGYHYDMYVKQSHPEGNRDTVYVQIEVQNRIGNTWVDYSYDLMSDMYQCVARTQPAATGNSYKPCTRD